MGDLIERVLLQDVGIDETQEIVIDFKNKIIYEQCK